MRRLVRNKKYPKWFSIYSKPYKPTKPDKVLKTTNVIKRITVDSYGTINVGDLEGAFRLEFKGVFNDYGGDKYIEIDLIGEDQEVLDPDYEEKLKVYEKTYKEYKERLGEWKKYKKMYDEEQAAEQLARDRAMYEKLKIKLGEQ